MNKANGSVVSLTVSTADTHLKTVNVKPVLKKLLILKTKPNHPLPNVILNQSAKIKKRTRIKKKKNSLVPTVDETKRRAKKTPKVKKIPLPTGWVDGGCPATTATT
jgi:hypothetical protein